MDRFVLVVNPRAGGGRARAQLKPLQAELRRLGAEFETIQTRGPNDATAIVRDQLTRGIQGVAVVGGDGTVSEAVGGFFDTKGEAIAPADRWISPLPCGTGSDFCRTAGIQGSPKALARRLCLSEPKPIDAGWITYTTEHGRESRAFINIASFGLAGEIDRLVNASGKRLGGFATFLGATLRARATFKAPLVQLTVDEQETEEVSITNVAVANGRYQGGGMCMAPSAELDDGWFELVRVERNRLFPQLALIPRLYSGGIVSAQGVTHQRCKQLFASALGDEKVFLDIDGESPGFLPAQFEIRPGILSLR